MSRTGKTRSRGHVAILILLGYALVVFMGYCDIRTVTGQEVTGCDSSDSLAAP